MPDIGKEDLTSLEAWRATFAEFLAVSLFVFLGAGSVVVTATLTGGDLTASRLLTIALANGFAIAFLVYATANISVGHLNPAVTFAAVWTHQISVSRGLMYGGAQVAGATVWGLLLLATIPDAADTNLGAHALGPDVSVGMALMMEIVLTFILAFLIFATAVDPGGVAPLAPVAIGLAVLVGHLVAVPITGASMNPARSFGPALVAGERANHWIYWIGPLIGGLLAGMTYKIAFLNRPR